MGTLSRRRLLAAAGAATVGAAAGSLFGFNILRRVRKNVVFVISDALRADRLGCYGYRSSFLSGSQTPTPCLDRLAGRGVLFERCISPSSWTLQSVAAIMSSRLPFIEGEQYNEGFAPRGIPTLAEALSNAGYDTIALTSNPWLSLPEAGKSLRLAASRGFASWHTVSTEMIANPMYANRIGPPMVYERYVGASEMMRRVTATLRKRSSGERPFFLYLHFMDTHEPYNPPESYKTSCLVPRQKRVPDFMLYQFLRSMVGVIGREEVRPQDMELFQRACALYDASVRYVDDAVRALVGYFARNGMDGDTLFVFSADHGEEFQEHGWLGHSRKLYEESVHVPLVFFGADVARGARIGDQMSSLDIAPTILSACGVPAPEGMVGRQLDLSGRGGCDPLPVISALVRPCEPGKLNEKIFAASEPRGMKLIRNEFQCSKAGTRPRDELFDRRTDPWEKTDISEARASVTAALGKQLQLLREVHKSEVGRGITIDEATRQQLKALGYLGG